MGVREEETTGEVDPPTDETPEEGTDEAALAESDDPGLDDDEPESRGRRSRVLRLARRLMDTREITSDTKEIIGSVIGASDRAKTEAVRMAAREVRHYLDELKLKDDILNLMTSYSLEVSFSLKPLADAVKKEELDDDDSEDEPLPDAEPAT